MAGLTDPVFVMTCGVFGAMVVFVLSFWLWISRRRRRKAELEITPPDWGKLLRPAGHHLQEQIAALTEEHSDCLLTAVGWAVSAGAFTVIGVLAAAQLAGFSGTEHWSSGHFQMAILSGACLVVGGFCGWRAWCGGRRVMRIVEKLERYRLGLRGEQAVAEALQSPEVAGDGYVSFHDVPLDNGGNADHVVVGPGGVFVIETKACSQQKPIAGSKRNRIKFDGTTAQFPSGQWNDKASVQAQSAARQVEGWLKGAVPGVEAEPLLVFPGWEVHMTTKDGLSAMSSRSLQFYFQKLPACFTSEELESMRASLDRRCRDVSF